MLALGKKLAVGLLQAVLLAQSLHSQELVSDRADYSSRKARDSHTHQPVHFRLGDTSFPYEKSEIRIQTVGEAVGLAFAADDVYSYPQHVSHDPGFPAKPHRERPGDINRSNCPPERYQQDDNVRSGWPQTLRKWTAPSVNPHYSAWYVGGGSAWIFPCDRGRSCQEGTWGLDYSVWKKPGSVWMHWTHGRPQGGLGAYQTDR